MGVVIKMKNEIERVREMRLTFLLGLINHPDLSPELKELCVGHYEKLKKIIDEHEQKKAEYEQKETEAEARKNRFEMFMIKLHILLFLVGAVICFFLEIWNLLVLFGFFSIVIFVMYCIIIIKKNRRERENGDKLYNDKGENGAGTL